jgi:hypothetical protein
MKGASTVNLSFVITLGRRNKDKNIFPRGRYADVSFTTMHKRVIESECMIEKGDVSLLRDTSDNSYERGIHSDE